MNRGPEGRIYHIVLASELSRCMQNGSYEPTSLQAEGFVHCSGTPAQVLEVANAFFSAIPDRVLVLQVELSKLSSRVAWEPAAPVAGQAVSETDGQLFPHIYGSVNLDAVSGVGVLRDAGDVFAWPVRWSPVARHCVADE